MSHKWANSDTTAHHLHHRHNLEFLEIDSLTTNNPRAFGKFIKRWVSKRTRHNSAKRLAYYERINAIM